MHGSGGAGVHLHHVCACTRVCLYHLCACTTCVPAPRAYLDGIVFLVWLNDPQIQEELSKYQEGIQDHQADDDDLVGRSRGREPRMGPLLSQEPLGNG